MAVLQKLSWSIFQALVQICILTNLGNAQSIKVYSDYNFEGNDTTVEISECTNLSNEMARTVSSVNTRDNCARLYDKWNCAKSGRFIEVMARSPSHNNLREWSFDNKARSIGPCANSCDPGVIGENPKVDELGELVIYKEKQFKGDYLKLDVQGCTRIPAQFVQNLSSVETFDKCFQLYNTIDCRLNGSNIDTIELRRGTPNHDDISTWYLARPRSVSHCSFKCFERSKQDAICKPTKANEVVFFEKQSYKGSCTSLTVSKCTNKEGIIRSIKTFNKFCISLYDDPGCGGKSLNVVGGILDLSTTFSLKTKSVQPCSGVTDSFRPSTGRSAKDLEVSISFPFIILAIVSLLVFGVLITSVVVMLIMRRYNPRGDILGKLTRKEIEEFIQGLGLNLGRDVEGGVDNDYSAELLAQNMPYNEEYEVPRSNIKFDQRTPLGMGQSGIVYKGTITKVVSDNYQGSSEKTIQVAVKTIKPGSSSESLRSLLKEVKNMLYIGKHNHIVQLIGCCTDNLSNGELFVLLEFCSRGSLESILQKNRENFENLVVKGRLVKKSVDYLESADSPNLNKPATQKPKQSGLSRFDFFQLLRWCMEVASGMEYLSSRKVIHGDVAARNVLLDEDLRAKISDFGLSRQLQYSYTEYVKQHQEPLPWRWLAIESIKSMEFSSKSDVWSFEVLCWEIFTLGEKPYPGVAWNNDFLRNLQDGLRLPKPTYTVSECYNLMIQCWNENSSERPGFSEILEELRDIFESLNPTLLQSFDIPKNEKYGYTELRSSS